MGSRQSIALWALIWLFIVPAIAGAAPAKSDDCGAYLRRIAHTEAKKIIPFWKPWSRRKLAREIETQVRSSLGDLSTSDPTQIQIAVAKAIEEYELSISDRLTLKAKLLFAGALIGNGVAIPLLTGFLPEGVRPYATFFAGGVGLTVLSALSGPVMKRIEATAERWASKRRDNDGEAESDYARELTGIAMQISGKINSLQEWALGRINEADMVVQTKLMAAMTLVESLGQRDRAARLVASAIKAYLKRYPGIPNYEKSLSEGWQVLLEYADQGFRDDVYREVVSDPEFAPNVVRVNQVLDAWMPKTKYSGGEASRGRANTDADAAA